MATIYGRVPPPEMQLELLNRQETQQVIGDEDVAKAISTLQKYKDGKANLEERVIQDEQWWKLRHWEVIRGKKQNNFDSPQPSSAWLFNTVLNKHADAMDNYPEPAALPREKSDKDSATMLSSVLPVVMEYNEFEQVYSDGWWEKLKHGTAVYGVFWDKTKENGLGDIAIRGIDLLKIFWEPGITDIQKSRNLFIVDLIDEDILNDQYPEYKGKLKGNGIDVKQYIYDDTVDTSDKAVVVDWYYKRSAPDGRTVVQYAKIVGNTLLYASENDPEYQQRGWYDHGQYPVIMDTMFPEKGTPVGFGLIAISKDPQIYIDKLMANILESSLMNTKKRFFISSSTNINEEEFSDWNKPFVHVEGSLDDTRVKEIVCQPINNIYLAVVQQKIEEMKDTAGNRDVNSGGTGSGVTSGAAIAALQEAGNKVSRDMISAAYRAFTNVCEMVVELMRQFYEESRAFRIIAPNVEGGYDFVDFDNSKIKDQQIGVDAQGAPLFRRPIFDIKIKAQKQNPFSKMEQNENAKELYRLGFFAPEKAQEASIAIDAMNFEGIDEIREKILQGQTLFNICQQLMQENQMLKMAMNATMPIAPNLGQNRPPSQAGEEIPAEANNPPSALANGSPSPMRPYTQKILRKSQMDMSRPNNSATPGTGR